MLETIDMITIFTYFGVAFKSSLFSKVFIMLKKESYLEISPLMVNEKKKKIFRIKLEYGRIYCENDLKPSFGFVC